MEHVDVVVVGAGVVGLACARALALQGRDVLILDQAGLIGSETSSRNSEVVHAGIYYPTGSVKAVSCLAGKRKLYDFCESRGVPYRKCGKLIVATSEQQRADLRVLQAKALENGVDGDEALQLMTREAALEMEPQLDCVEALWSPSSGIVDSHAFMLALQGEAEAHGAMTVLNTSILGGHAEADGVVLETGGEAPMTLKTRLLINSAGHHAPALARQVGGRPGELAPRTWLAKGSYFGLATKAPFSRLVYPIPEPGGLGVHITIDLGGRARFGPDVEWVKDFDYEVDPARAERFYDAVRKYWPAMPDNILTPDYSGIRPKITGPGNPSADFRIDGPGVHGDRHQVHLFGIESPGLTASLALADMVVKAASASV